MSRPRLTGRQGFGYQAGMAERRHAGAYTGDEGHGRQRTGQRTGRVPCTQGTSRIGVACLNLACG
jgi:hypothetical protein